MYQCLLRTSIIFLYLFCVNAYNLKQLFGKPPTAKYGFDSVFVQQDEIDAEIDAWDPEDGTNIWEYSGLFEGDIMLYKTQQHSVKNGLIEETRRWPKAIIPYYIDDSFTDDEVASILKAMQEYHDKTCVRFRPYVRTDQNWIDIKQDYPGCWSSVGRKEEGQIVNFGNDKCRRHGVIIHELMHAMGFFHQQSASDRDDYIKIHWENIRKGREHNFNKYNESVVTNFNVTYDYLSVMHYSGKAFSKNGEITIEPIFESSNLGQRDGLSEKDILKVNAMYSDECNNNTVNILDIHEQMVQQQQEVTPYPMQQSYLDSIIKWFESIFSLADYIIKRRV